MRASATRIWRLADKSSDPSTLVRMKSLVWITLMLIGIGDSLAGAA
jgi:hypothetical protein